MHLSRAFLVAFMGLLAVAGCQDDAADGPKVKVPSGREVTLIDVITNAPGPNGAAARFRFLAPGLSDADAEAAAQDMQMVCDSFAVSRIDGMVPEPQQIIISFMSETVPFGEPAPNVVQFFESYRVENDSCIWEVF
jgi:Family of unknown function (DUF6497)